MKLDHLLEIHFIVNTANHGRFIGMNNPQSSIITQKNIVLNLCFKIYVKQKMLIKNSVFLINIFYKFRNSK